MKNGVKILNCIDNVEHVVEGVPAAIDFCEELTDKLMKEHPELEKEVLTARARFPRDASDNISIELIASLGDTVVIKIEPMNPSPFPSKLPWKVYRP